MFPSIPLHGSGRVYQLTNTLFFPLRDNPHIRYVRVEWQMVCQGIVKVYIIYFGPVNQELLACQVSRRSKVVDNLAGSKGFLGQKNKVYSIRLQFCAQFSRNECWCWILSEMTYLPQLVFKDVVRMRETVSTCTWASVYIATYHQQYYGPHCIMSAHL